MTSTKQQSDKGHVQAPPPSFNVPILFLARYPWLMVTKRKTGLADPTPILANMKACRDAMIELQQRYDHKTAINREARAMVRSIDDLGLLITGKPDLFRDAGHSTPLARDA